MSRLNLRPEKARQMLAERVLTRHEQAEIALLKATGSAVPQIHSPSKERRYNLPMNLALDPASEQVIQRELDRGHFIKPAEVVASALRLLNSHEDWLQENREASASASNSASSKAATAKPTLLNKPANSSPSTPSATNSE